MIHMRTCELSYHIKGPITVNEAKIGLFRKIAAAEVQLNCKDDIRNYAI